MDKEKYRDKEEFNRRDVAGAIHTDAMHIRMPKRLAVFIKTLALLTRDV